MEAELAKYGASGVAIGALILVGWTIRIFLTRVLPTIEANTKATEEMTAYLKLRNGTSDKVFQHVTEVLNGISVSRKVVSETHLEHSDSKPET